MQHAIKLFVDSAHKRITGSQVGGEAAPADPPVRSFAAQSSHAARSGQRFDSAPAAERAEGHAELLRMAVTQNIEAVARSTAASVAAIKALADGDLAEAALLAQSIQSYPIRLPPIDQHCESHREPLRGETQAWLRELTNLLHLVLNQCIDKLS